MSSDNKENDNIITDSFCVVKGNVVVRDFALFQLLFHPQTKTEEPTKNLLSQEQNKDALETTL